MRLDEITATWRVRARVTDVPELTTRSGRSAMQPDTVDIVYAWRRDTGDWEITFSVEGVLTKQTADCPARSRRIRRLVPDIDAAPDWVDEAVSALHPLTADEVQ